ncbi:MAG: ImmA/IrrE family metallo-endopeptidase [Planctomycetia bacterium]|nr:ImmA/IrrE family metallo-endopeptidase [Planctomycetia bacterium]
MRKDDGTLTPQGQSSVRKYADLLLRKADAYGRLPTPVNDLIDAAKLEIARENALDKVYLGELYRALPNAFKLVPDRLKRAAGKVLGLLDRPARTIHLDPGVHRKKQTFLSLHEVAHDALPWQRQTFALLEDSENELDPETHDQYEREANCFASEVLFQLDGFAEEAADWDFGIRTPLKLSARFGSSFYAAARRYVVTGCRPSALLVFEQPVVRPELGEYLVLRRAVVSPSFGEHFGEVRWPHECGPGHFFTRYRPRNKLTAPTPFRLMNAEGTHVACLAEAFDSTHQIFFLLCPLKP